MRLLVIILFFYIFIKIAFYSMAIIICMIISRRKKRKISDVKDIIFVNSKCKPGHSKYKKWLINCCSGLEKLLIMKIGTIPSHFFRLILYKYIFKMELESNVVIYYGGIFRCPYYLTIGKNSIIGDRAKIDARQRVIIGSNVNIGSDVEIWTGQHDKDDAYFGYEGHKVIIGDRAWISNNVIILPGVTVGEGAVCAAGAIVTKDVEKYTIVAGIPAKEIGRRNMELQYQFDGMHDWFI